MLYYKKQQATIKIGLNIMSQVNLLYFLDWWTQPFFHSNRWRIGTSKTDFSEKAVLVQY